MLVARPTVTASSLIDPGDADLVAFRLNVGEQAQRHGAISFDVDVSEKPTRPGSQRAKFHNAFLTKFSQSHPANRHIGKAMTEAVPSL